MNCLLNLSHTHTHTPREGERERTLRGDHGSEAKQMFCQIYWLSEVGGTTRLIHAQIMSDHTLVYSVCLVYMLKNLPQTQYYSLKK